MNLWRSKSASTARTIRRAYKPTMQRLDERIVPDTTGVVATPDDPTTPGTTSTVTPGIDGSDPSAGSTTDSTGSTTSDPASTTTTTTTTSTGTTTTTTTLTAPRVYAVSADGGNDGRVIVYDNTGAKKFDFLAYPNTRAGVHATMGDLTGDGVADILTGPGPAQAPTIKVYDGVSGQRLMSFNAYDKSFRGGVQVAIGDIDGDGRADIVTGAGDGGGSHVKVFSGAALFPADPVAALYVEPGPNAYVYREFFAYDAQYLVGARVAVADVDGDGRNDIVTAPGMNGGPHLRVFSGVDGTIFREWFAFDANFRGGVFVTAGDLNGDGRADVVTGMGANGIGEVKVFDGRTNRLTRAFLPSGAGVRVSSRLHTLDYDADGDLDILVGNLNAINAYDGRTFSRIGGLTPFDPSHIGGVFFA